LLADAEAIKAINQKVGRYIIRQIHEHTRSDRENYSRVQGRMGTLPDSCSGAMASPGSGV